MEAVTQPIIENKDWVPIVISLLALSVSCATFFRAWAKDRRERMALDNAKRAADDAKIPYAIADRVQSSIRHHPDYNPDSLDYLKRELFMGGTCPAI